MICFEEALGFISSRSNYLVLAVFSFKNVHNVECLLIFSSNHSTFCFQRVLSRLCYSVSEVFVYFVYGCFSHTVYFFFYSVFRMISYCVTFTVVFVHMRACMCERLDCRM